MADTPWLDIPAAEYHAHMRAAGQDHVLREIFQRVVAEVRPARVAVLGCGSGADLATLDPVTTKLVAGVDINPRYLDLAAEHLHAFGERLRLICADVLAAELPAGPYDLVHAALVLEYVDPDRLLARAHDWLAPAGTLSVVIQEPVANLPAVSDTPFQSLRALDRWMILRTAGDVIALAANAGFALATRRTVKLPSGKRLVSLQFDKARPERDRPRRSARC